jgi:uncharacterized protein YxeA
MKAKKILIITVVAAMAIIGGFFFFSKPQKGHFDNGKFMAAIHAYCSDAKEHNNTLPSSISLQELIARGFLKDADVNAFDGMKVTVYLTVDEKDPQAVLMRAQSSDGSQIVALADGSVQQVAK